MNRSNKLYFAIIAAHAAAVGCAHPAAKTPPEPPVTQVAPAPSLDLAPVPAPKATAPGPVDPPPDVLHVRDDGQG